jgi:hypothetical protein
MSSAKAVNERPSNKARAIKHLMVGETAGAM